MPDIHTPNEKVASRQDDAGNVLVGRPTVAANSGTDLHHKALKAFIASDLSMAEWIRLPAPRARCWLTQMSRTTLNEAIERGDVRAITVRQPGATRGIKLLNRASLLAWLGRLDAEQNGAAKFEVSVPAQSVGFGKSVAAKLLTEQTKEPKEGER